MNLNAEIDNYTIHRPRGHQGTLPQVTARIKVMGVELPIDFTADATLDQFIKNWIIEKIKERNETNG